MLQSVSNVGLQSVLHNATHININHWQCWANTSHVTLQTAQPWVYMTNAAAGIVLLTCRVSAAVPGLLW